MRPRTRSYKIRGGKNAMSFALDSFDDGFEVNDDFKYSTKIMVFGVGGGGGNAVSHMVN